MDMDFVCAFELEYSRMVDFSRINIILSVDAFSICRAYIHFQFFWKLTPSIATRITFFLTMCMSFINKYIRTVLVSSFQGMCLL